MVAAGLCTPCLMLSLTLACAFTPAAAYAPGVLRVPARRNAPVMVVDAAELSIKENLMSLLSGGLQTPSDMQGEINEVLLSLERSNPTASPAQSTLINGVWGLQYAGTLAPGVIDSPTRELALSIYSSSYNAGVLKTLLNKLPFDASLSDVAISIVSLEAGQPRVTTEVRGTGEVEPGAVHAPKAVRWCACSARHVALAGDHLAARHPAHGPLLLQPAASERRSLARGLHRG